ncbi:MFS transporter [Spirosoma sp. BT702]|uniref:MFS transporter n=1 Tax=Spirosoma profusum TaxID=2771354 RepID=A0A926Y4S1_9BACT|nr:MFS transporter [Spirosoma profusum]MBD2703521.1 MFS transporter [Spirosoma profusum]
MSSNEVSDFKPKLFSYAWLVVLMLCLVGGLNYLDRMMITTMRLSILKTIPMTDAQFGLLTSTFLWIYGLLSPFAGYLADKFNRSRVIIGSLFIWSVVTWLTSRATTYEELLVTRALMGISEACYIPAAVALIVDYHKGATKSLATGIHMAGVYVGQSLGFIGAWLAENNSWNYAFTVFGSIGIGYAIVLFFSLKEAPKTEEVSLQGKADGISFGDAVKKLFKEPAYVMALAAWGLLGVVSWIITGWLPTFYQEKFNLTQTQAGVYSTGYFFPAMLVGVLSGGAIADFWTKFNPKARIIVPAIGLVLATPGIFLGSQTSVLWITIAGFLLYAFTRPFIDANMMPILSMVADRKYLATGYGILNLFSCVIGGVGIYAGGVLRDAHVNLSFMFQVAAVVMLLCAFLLYRTYQISMRKSKIPQINPEPVN